MSKFNNKLLIASVSVLRVKTNRGITLALLFALALALFPAEAYPDCNVTGDIPFTVSNNAIELCFQCGGPWFRVSEVVKLNAGQQNCKFYAANITSFSPFGEWDCTVFSIGSDGKCNTLDPVTDTSVCVEYKSPPPQFTIDVLDRSINVDSNLNPPDPFCSSSVSAFLGDNPRQEKSKPDSDVFVFTGSAGDEVRLTLEADPKDGNNGGEASLGLTGDSLNEATSGNLPLEINATLPADGLYSISAEQPRKTSGLRYRGSYNLILDSRAGVDLIEPTTNVEK